MIKFTDLPKQWDAIEKSAAPKLMELVRNGPFILGKYVKEFEDKFARECKTSYAVGVSNGTDGLKLAIQALDMHPSTPVVIPANAYIADAMAPTYLNHPIELIDCDKHYNMDVNLLSEYVERNRHSIIMPVHMYGQPSDMLSIAEVSENNVIIGDCSQAHGSSINSMPIGSFGIASVFSLYPTKNLGALGDAGVIVTNNETLYNRLIALRNYGSCDKQDYEHVGWNHRLDEIQALFLLEKLPYLKSWNEKRQQAALLYNKELEGVVKTPKQASYNDGSVHYVYPIRTKERDALKEFLSSKEIPTLIHYPTTIQKTKLFGHRDGPYIGSNAVKYSKEILSLPIHPFISEEEILYISSAIKEFFKR